MLESNAPAWIVDVTKDTNFPRAAAAQAIGVKAGFAIPVSIGDDVVAVMEFFSNESAEPDQRALETLGNVGQQLGGAIRRKIAEQDLADKEALLRIALDNMTDGMYVLDRDQNFVLYNDQYVTHVALPDGCIYVGGSIENTVRAHAERGDFGPGKPEEIIERRLKALAGSDTVRTELRVDSNRRTLDLRKASVAGGGAVVVITDVTEQKLAERKLAFALAQIQESVDYASNIQRATLPAEGFLDLAFADHFVIWEPRDVVGGDIYWLLPIEGGFMLGVADCTGHGVPGAFVTLVASSAIRHAIASHPDGDPAQVIAAMNHFIKEVLAQYADDAISDDGLELGLCRIIDGHDEMTFAGARFSLWVVDNGEMREVKGDKTGVGYKDVPLKLTLKNHTVACGDGAGFYMFSDGFNDQIGGPRRRGFGKRKILDHLSRLCAEPMAMQRDAVMSVFSEHQGDEERRDDLTMIGFKL